MTAATQSNPRPVLGASPCVDPPPAAHGLQQPDSAPWAGLPFPSTEAGASAASHLPAPSGPGASASTLCQDCKHYYTAPRVPAGFVACQLGDSWRYRGAKAACQFVPSRFTIREIEP